MTDYERIQFLARQHNISEEHAIELDEADYFDAGDDWDDGLDQCMACGRYDIVDHTGYCTDCYARGLEPLDMPEQIEQTKTATKIATRTVTLTLTGHALQSVYRLEPPIDVENATGMDAEMRHTFNLPDEAKYVVSSAIPHAFDHGEPETLLFAADERGTILSHIDLGGERGVYNNDSPLHLMGYTIELSDSYTRVV